MKTKSLLYVIVTIAIIGLVIYSKMKPAYHDENQALSYVWTEIQKSVPDSDNEDYLWKSAQKEFTIGSDSILYVSTSWVFSPGNNHHSISFNLSVKGKVVMNFAAENLQTWRVQRDERYEDGSYLLRSLNEEELKLLQMTYAML